MVKGYRTSYIKMEKMPLRDRDEYLCRQLGIEQSDIENVRNAKYDERPLKGAELLYRKAGNAALTIQNISAICSDSDIVKACAATQWALHKRYDHEMLEIRKKTGLKPSFVHLLRRDIGAYSGNLIEAVERYPGISAGKSDWLRNIKIPTELGYWEGVLLGCNYFAKFENIYNRRSEQKSTMLINATETNDEFVYGTYLSLLATKHNLEPSISKTDIIVFSSGAVYSWLKEHVGLGGVEFPKLSSDAKRGFFDGIIAFRFYLKDKALGACVDNEKFADQMVKRAEDFGFGLKKFERNSHGEKTYELRFNSADTKRLNLLNPKHERPIVEMLKKRVDKLKKYNQIMTQENRQKQKELAKKLGVTIANINEWLNKGTRPVFEEDVEGMRAHGLITRKDANIYLSIKPSEIYEKQLLMEDAQLVKDYLKTLSMGKSGLSIRKHIMADVRRGDKIICAWLKGEQKPQIDKKRLSEAIKYGMLKQDELEQYENSL